MIFYFNELSRVGGLKVGGKSSLDPWREKGASWVSFEDPLTAKVTEEAPQSRQLPPRRGLGQARMVKMGQVRSD
jgi:hypothetical protein